MSAANKTTIQAENEISIKELIVSCKNLITFLLERVKLIIVFSIVFSLMGYLYAKISPVKYVGRLTFALEEEKGGTGLGGAVGIATSLGIDLGASGGGAFSSSNLVELMKSRLLVEKALLNTIVFNGESKTLATYYMEIVNKLDFDSSDNNFFPINVNRNSFTRQQDSILGVIYKNIIGSKDLFSVSQKDKKVSILTIETKSKDELFSKFFTESIAKEVSDFYIETKSKKARNNLLILQRQTDSVRNELNKSITGVAIANDQTFNLNSAILVPKTSGLKKEVDVEANKAVLTQLVANLEMAKVSLRRETPLIQVIDHPILPLEKEKLGAIVQAIKWGLIGFILISALLLAIRWLKEIGI